jgi:uncharacterized protein (DUF488 family)
MNRLYTIGFTQKSAKIFFGLLNSNPIDIVLDIRLNNTSQLAAFSKYPDIEFFLKEICDITYKHDVLFAPTDDILVAFKKKQITWDEYVAAFEKIKKDRKLKEHIVKNYMFENNICLLCSEQTPNQCHRSLVANMFTDLNSDIDVVNL